MTTKGTKKPDAQEFAKAGVEQFEAAVKTSQENAEKAFKAGKENADKAYKASADVLTDNVEKIYVAAKEQMTKVWPTMGVKMDEMTEWSRGNLDAFLAASEIAKKGAEAMAEEMIAFNQAAFDGTGLPGPEQPRTRCRAGCSLRARERCRGR